jgi:hypothetical protein
VIAPLASRWVYLVGCRAWRCCTCETHNDEREFFCGRCCPLEQLPKSTVKRQKVFNFDAAQRQLF